VGLKRKFIYLGFQKKKVPKVFSLFSHQKSELFSFIEKISAR